MRWKGFWAWIVCLALLACCLSACSLFGEKQSETAQNQPTQEAGSAPVESQNTSMDAAVSSEKESQPEQSTPARPVENNKQEDTSAAAEAATEVELPEIEIPIMDDNNRNDGRDGGHESTAPESSENDKPSNGSKPTSKPQEPTSTPSSSAAPQTEPSESNNPTPTPEAPPSVSVTPQPEPEPEPEPEPDPKPTPGNSDITIDNNGDILLPEVP